jgi:RNA polymerase sigma-70 factor (ECF subfamily)
MSDKFKQNEIRKLIGGDERSFERIFNMYYSSLVFYAKEYVIIEDQAREIVQETFIKLWENRQSLSPDSNIRAYLFIITRNLCLNHLNHLRVGQQFKRMKEQDVLTTELNTMALQDSSSEYLIASELENEIERLIEELPDQNKKVFRMHRFDQMKYSEIAQQLNISVKAVEAHISRALKHLREHLKDYLYIF